jgi:superfamily II DNA helicase RecQ
VQAFHDPSCDPDSLMALRFFTIPVQADDDAAQELNSFLNAHKVLSVERHFVDQGVNSFWAICVDFFAGESKKSPVASRGRSQVDYKEILSSDEFTVFSELRRIRKEISQKEAVPVYAIFTNEQLAQMVQRRCRSKTALLNIEGIGEGRVEKYGSQILEVLCVQLGPDDETNEPAVSTDT